MEGTESVNDARILCGRDTPRSCSEHFETSYTALFTMEPTQLRRGRGGCVPSLPSKLNLAERLVCCRHTTAASSHVRSSRGRQSSL